MEFIVKIVSVIGGRGRIIGQSKNVTEWKIRLSDYGVEWKKLSEYGAEWKKLSEYGAKGEKLSEYGAETEWKKLSEHGQSEKS